MAKLKTLTFSPISYSHSPDSPQTFITKINMRDWDDNQEMNISVRTPSPVVQIEDISMRMLVAESGEARDATIAILAGS